MCCGCQHTVNLFKFLYNALRYKTSIVRRFGDRALSQFGEVASALNGRIDMLKTLSPYTIAIAAIIESETVRMRPAFFFRPRSWPAVSAISKL